MNWKLTSTPALSGDVASLFSTDPVVTSLTSSIATEEEEVVILPFLRLLFIKMDVKREVWMVLEILPWRSRLSSDPPYFVNKQGLYRSGIAAYMHVYDRPHVTSK